MRSLGFYNTCSTYRPPHASRMYPADTRGSCTKKITYSRLIASRMKRGIRRRRLKQLKRSLTSGDDVCPDTPRSDLFRRLNLQTDRVALEGQCVFDVLHGDADMVEDGLHVGRGRVGPGTLIARPMSSAAAL